MHITLRDMFAPLNWFGKIVLAPLILFLWAFWGGLDFLFTKKD